MTDTQRTKKRVCTKDNPFVPPLKDDEWWKHQDAYEKFPEYEFSIVIFHCPHCGIDIHIDTNGLA